MDPGAIAIDTVDNSYYNVLVEVGSQKQPFSLVIDTASSFTFVTAADTQSNEEHHFDCNSSSTCTFSNLLFPIWVVNGTEVQGSIIDDTIWINDTLSAKQDMLLVTNNDISFLQFPGDGQLGLEQRQKILGISVGFDTFLDNLQSQGLISARSFGIYLSNNTNDNSSSELYFGGYNSSHMALPTFTYYPLATNDAWQLKLSTVTFGSTTVNTSSSVTFDSRCSAIVASRDDFNSLLQSAQALDSSCQTQQYGGETFIRCNCSNNTNDYQNYPALQFVFNGFDNQYYIYPEQYVFHDVQGNCVLDIAQAGILSDSWSVGHSFMKNYYTYYDQDNNRIGIQAANQTS